MRSIASYDGLLLLTAATLLLVARAQQQNIDTTEPFVRVAPAGLDSEAYFGYNVILHRVATNDIRIVVSAPNGTAAGGTVDNTGVLYTCSLTQGTVCRPLNGDNAGDDRRLYDTDGNSASEIKMNQTLGISMDSRDNHFIVCAHRYINTGSGSSRLAQGSCYYTPNSNLQGFTRLNYCDGLNTRNYGNCQLGTSVALAATSGNQVHIGIGAPGAVNWQGKLWRRSSTGSVDRMGDGEGTNDNAWQGYALTKGRIIDRNREDFVVSVPRRANYFGTVNIVSNDEDLDVFTQPLQGMQLAEYYGFSLATVDLNNDGFDELLVGAPMFSTQNQPEVGRVYVYRNTQGSLSFVKTIAGDLQYGRFGHAITNLGDINNDGLEDVAISAPFGEGSGKVYIYYGSLTDVLANTPAQVINGSDFNSSSSLIAQPSGFGSSLSSSLDIDGNGVNDLVIGAFLSQQVFLLRSRAVAQVSVTISASPIVVDVQVASSNTTCMLSGTAYPCFNVTACGSYPNLATLSNNLELTFNFVVDGRNVMLGLEQRVFFDNGGQTHTQSVTRNFVKNVEQCITETAYVRNDISDRFNGFPVEVTVTGPTFTASSSDGDPMRSNLINYPIVTTEGSTQLSVETLKECANTQCIPDLRLTRLNATFETTSGTTTNILTAGSVTNMNFWMNFTNLGDDAFLAQLTFSLDSSRFEFIRIEPRELLISCTSEVQGNMTRLNCPIANPLGSNVQRTLGVRLRPTSSITGSEGTLTIQFNATSINDELPTTLDNNVLSYSFNVQAQADIFLDQAVTMPEQVSYINTNMTSTVNVTQVTDLGPQITASFVVRNDGPTTVPVTELRIRWPYRPSDNDDLFLTYPSQIMVSSSTPVTCNNTFINPMNLQRSSIENPGNEEENTETSENRRRRRTLAPMRGRSKRALERRQSSSGTTEVVDEVRDISIDCRNDQRQCVEIVCHVNQLPRSGSTQIDIVSHLDERYFSPRVDRFTFVIYATVEIINSSFIVQPNGHRPDSTETQFRAVTSIPPSTRGGVRVAAWMIIVPIVLALIFFIVLGVILYFVGFFKRKGKQKKEELTAQFLEEQQGGDTPADVAT